MKPSSILTIFLLTFTFSCRNAPDETRDLKKENARLRQEIDSLKKKNQLSDAAAYPVQPSRKSEPKDGVLRPGKHYFTLQWISWEEPGSVEIHPDAAGWYSIKGGQKSRKNSDNITIDGLIKQLSHTDLLFKGEIRSVVASNNNGEPCIKTGEYIFKTTQNRKYWRMQDMINCEGGLLTDYVDIYF